jgi:predicted nucleic acid-binding protein
VPEADKIPVTREDLETVRLEIDGPLIPLPTLVSAAGTFANIVHEVSRRFRGGTESVEWIVAVEEGSIVLPMKPQVPEAIRAELVRVVANGVEALEREATQPPYFTERALVQARALANLSTDDVAIRVRNGTAQPVRLTKQLVANVDRVTGEAPPRIGTIEALLEAADVHGRMRFAIWDRLTGERIECFAGEQITIDDLRGALGRRVGVRGRIRASKIGAKRRVDVQALRVFAAEEDLPSAEEVPGNPERLLVTRRYWDACAFLGWLAEEADKVEECRAVIRAAEEGKTLLVTSALTVAEVLWLRGKPRIPAETAQRVQRFFEHKYIVVNDLDRTSAEEAQRLVWHHDVRPKDAIHVATAADAEVDRLETFDEALIKKSGAIGNPRSKSADQTSRERCSDA